MLRLPIVRNGRSCRRIMFLRDQNSVESRSASTGRIPACFSTSNVTTQPNVLSRFPTDAGNVTFWRNIHLGSPLYSEVIEVEGPAFADSISEGDIRWIKQPGDFVEADELVAEIETDKTAVEVLAPQAGTIKELIVADGEKVEARQKIFKLELGGEAPAKPAAAAEAPPPAAAAPPPAAAAADSGPIPSDVPRPPPPQAQPISSKPVDSIQKTPARPAAPRPAAAPPAAKPMAPGKPQGVPPEQAITGARAETRIKMNRMRLKIAQRLKEAQNTCATLTTFNEIDMSTCMKMRTQYKDQFLKKHGIKFGFMSPFVRACAHALVSQPAVNAVIEEGEIVYRHFVDISVAVATPKGLVTPVLRGVEGMNYAQIEHGINELGVKARDGALAIEDMDGGTFTISNGGVFGSVFGTPIINMPQSAILGMHGIFERPVAINGKVEIRPMMYVALTYDHRLVDGREAVTFLRKVKQSVEDPGSMLLDL